MGLVADGQTRLAFIISTKGLDITPDPGSSTRSR
jgi:hypothetical protein